MIAPLVLGKWGGNLRAEEIQGVLRAMSERGHQETAIQLLAQRLESHPSEADYWEDLALDLVTTPELIRGGQMPAFYFGASGCSLSSKALCDDCCCNQQADRDSGIWFVEFSEASKVLNACIEQDARGVWRALKPHLATGEAIRFSAGFPAGIVDRMPANEGSRLDR